MSNSSPPVITVDGPSGTGKGTLSLRLARHLGWQFLDSGALYRVLGLVALEQNIVLTDEPRLAECANNLVLSFASEPDQEQIRVYLYNRDVSELIRTEDCASAASQVAAWPAVRTALLARQRAFQRPPGLVADGRDMGTVIFPNAELKIYLTATAEERAQRRYKQLKVKGIDVNLDHLIRDIVSRDVRDSERPASPLRPASDAIIVDTTSVDAEGVFSRVLALTEKIRKP
jgi:CMP/dCMP kinase